MSIRHEGDLAEPPTNESRFMFFFLPISSGRTKAGRLCLKCNTKEIRWLSGCIGPARIQGGQRFQRERKSEIGGQHSRTKWIWKKKPGSAWHIYNESVPDVVSWMKSSSLWGKTKEEMNSMDGRRVARINSQMADQFRTQLPLPAPSRGISNILR